MDSDAFQEWFDGWQALWSSREAPMTNLTVSEVMRAMFEDAWIHALKEAEEVRKEEYAKAWQAGYEEGYKHGTGASIP